MKKNITSNSFLHLLALSLVFSIAFSMISGCIPFDSKITREHDSAPPVIKYAQSGKIIADKYIATSSFLIGDTVNFIISVKNTSNNITKIHLKEYYPENVNESHTEFKPIDAVPASKKSKSIMLKEPIEFSGPSGERKFNIQVEDAENNLSNVYTLHLIIH